MNRKKLAVAWTILFLCAPLLYGGTNGGMAGAFGRMGAGARAKSLGDAYTGFADGPWAIYYNPGALPFLEKREFSSAISILALDRSLHFLSFATPLHPKTGKVRTDAGFGIGWLHAGIGDIDSRGFDGEPLDRMNQSSNLFFFSFANRFHPKVGVGITAKVAYETFGEIGEGGTSIDGQGFGLDFGVHSRPIENLFVGAQVKDIALKTTWNTTGYWTQGTTKSDKWPVQYRLGAAYRPLNGLLASADIEGSSEGDWRPHIGAEFMEQLTPRQTFALRAGLSNEDIAFGFGLYFAFWRVLSKVDFAYVVESIAPEDTQVLSWSVEF
ncbi:MAG: hypothetical protein V1784_07315 [bacterium]